MDHLVQFSGGVGSWATAKRVRERMADSDTLTLLFADTKMENPDLYRFLEDAAKNVQGNLIKIADGRDPWQVFLDVRFLGNSLLDPCSRILKRELLRRWIETNRTPNECVIYLGIDWSELHRYERAESRWKPYNIEAPLCEAPYLEKAQIFQMLRDEGIAIPELYRLGFPHNNCGGFCIKAGAGQFALLYKTQPKLFAYHERREQEVINYLGKDVSILKRTVKGVTYNMTLWELRERIERGENVGHDMGGCGCALD